MDNTKEAYCWVEVWDMDYKNRSRAGYINNSGDVFKQLESVSGYLPCNQWYQVYLCEVMKFGCTSDMFWYNSEKTIEENDAHLHRFIERTHQRIFEGTTIDHNKFQLVIVKKDDVKKDDVKKDDGGPYNVRHDFFKDSELARFLTLRGFTEEAVQIITRDLNITEVWQLQHVSAADLDKVHLTVGFKIKFKNAVKWSHDEFKGKSHKWTNDIQV
jgi:hypothetical protein